MPSDRSLPHISTTKTTVQPGMMQPKKLTALQFWALRWPREGWMRSTAHNPQVARRSRASMGWIKITLLNPGVMDSLSVWGREKGPNFPPELTLLSTEAMWHFFPLTSWIARVNVAAKTQFLGPQGSNEILDVSKSLHLWSKSLGVLCEGAWVPVGFYESVGQLRLAADSSVCKSSQRT